MVVVVVVVVVVGVVAAMTKPAFILTIKIETSQPRLVEEIID